MCFVKLFSSPLFQNYGVVPYWRAPYSCFIQSRLYLPLSTQWQMNIRTSDLPPPTNIHPEDGNCNFCHIWSDMECFGALSFLLYSSTSIIMEGFQCNISVLCLQYDRHTHICFTSDQDWNMNSHFCTDESVTVNMTSVDSPLPTLKID